MKKTFVTPEMETIEISDVIATSFALCQPNDLGFVPDP